jgi:hypothetical protein
MLFKLLIVLLWLVLVCGALDSKSIDVRDPSKVTLTTHNRTEISVSDTLVGFAFFGDQKVIYYTKEAYLNEDLSNPVIVTFTSDEVMKEHTSNSKYIITVYSRTIEKFCFKRAWIESLQIKTDFLCLFYLR